MEFLVSTPNAQWQTSVDFVLHSTRLPPVEVPVQGLGDVEHDGAGRGGVGRPQEPRLPVLRRPLRVVVAGENKPVD